MPIRQEHRECLIEALGAYPSIELLPKNILSEFVHVAGIDISPDAQEHIINAHCTARESDNNASADADIAALVNLVDDTRLDDIIFSKPLHCSDRNTNETIELELAEAELQIFSNVDKTFMNKVVDTKSGSISAEDVATIVDPEPFEAAAQEYISSFKSEEKLLEKRPPPQESIHNKKTKTSQSLVSDTAGVQLLQDAMNLFVYSWEQFSKHHQKTLNTLTKIENQLHRVCKEHSIDQVSDTVLNPFTVKCRDIIFDNIYVNWIGFKKGTILSANDLERQCNLIQSIIVAFEILLSLSMFTKNGPNILYEEVLKALVDFINNIFTNIISGTCTLPNASIPDPSGLINCGIIEVVKRTSDILHTLTDFTEKYAAEQLVGLVTNLNISLSIHSVNGTVTKGIIASLKAQCMSFMIKVSQVIPDSRPYIIHEILQDAYTSHDSKEQFKSFTISNGKHISMMSALIFQICQGIGLKDAKSLYKDMGHLDDVSLSNKQILHVAENIKKQSLMVDSLAQEICVFLLSKLSESSDKSYLEGMINDLLKMVKVPEFSYSEKFLGILLTLMMSEVMKSNLTPSLEIIFIDLCGKIASSLYSVEQKTAVVLSENCSVSQIIQHRRVMHRLLVDLKTQQSVRVSDSNLAFVVVKTISDISTICASSESSIPDSSGRFLNAEVQLQLLKYLKYLLQVLLEERPARYNQESDLLPSSYGAISLSSTLISALDRFGDFVLNLAKSTKVKVRSRCIKLLADLADSSPEILKYKWVQNTINEMLDDSSAVVRDSVLELLKKFLSNHHNLVDEFQGSLCSSLSDGSVLVRKRVIKILMAVYELSSSIATRINIASQILVRAEEEEDAALNLAIKNALINLWFAETEIYNNNVEVARIIVGVAKGSTRLYKLTVNFIRKEVIEGSTDEIKIRLKKILDETIDFIILNIDTDNRKSAKDLLKLVALFTESDGSLLTQQHLVLFQSFLVEGTFSNDSVSFPTLQIFKSAIPTIRALNPSFVENTMEYLLNGITKFSTRELHTAFPCAWYLCKYSGNTSKLSSAAISTMRMIYPFMEVPKLPTKDLSTVKLMKLLDLLGCFGAYCDFEIDRPIFMKSSLGLKEKESVVSLITKFLLVFSEPQHIIEVRSTAIKNLLHVCATHPKLLISPPILKVLDTELQSDNSVTKMVVINGVIHFLNKQEEELTMKAGNKEIVSSSTKLDKDAFVGEGNSYVNDGVCTAIVQRFLPTVLELCLQSEASNSPVNFLSLSLKLGFANPKVCLPYILALHSSSDSQVKRTAIQLHKKLIDRFESLTESSYPEGLRLAIDYRRRVSDSIFSDRFFLKAIYSVVCKTLNSRRKFVQELAKLLSIGTHTSLKEAMIKRDGTLFIILNLQELDYMTLEEVIILMSALSNALSRDAMDLNSVIGKVTSKTKLDTIQVQCAECEIVLMFLHLWNFFMAKYDLDVEDAMSYMPGRASLELRQAPSVRHEVSVDFDFAILQVDLESRESISALFTKFTSSMLDYSM